jgi:hypothetical protein
MHESAFVSRTDGGSLAGEIAAPTLHHTVASEGAGVG